YAPLWAPSTAYTAGQVVTANGISISRIANGTSRANYDSTEQALWTPVAATAAAVAGKLDRKISNLGPHGELFGVQSILANADIEKVTIACLGGSQFEGVGATNFLNRFPRKFGTLLNRKFGGVSVNEVFTPARRSSGVPVEAGAWVASGSTGANSRGPRGNATDLIYDASTPGSVTGTFTATKFRFFFYRLNNGTVTITIDGNATTFAATAGRELLWESATLAAGSHTVTITATAGSLLFCGGEHINSPTDKGVHVWDLSVSGASAKKRNLGAEWPGADNWPNWIGLAYTPDLIMIGLLFNDASESTAAQYKVNMQGVIDKARAKTACPILLCPGWGPSTTYGNWIDPRDAYTQVLRELADTNARVAFHNLDELVPSHQNADYPIYNGSPHFNDRGQALHAQLTVDALELAGSSANFPKIAVSVGPGPEPEPEPAVTYVPLSLTNGLVSRFTVQSLTDAGMVDGTAVESWPVAQGSKTLPLTQATPALRPTYRATGSVDGKPCVEFLGSATQWMATAVWDAPVPSPATLYAVVEATVSPAASQNIMSGISGSAYLGLQNSNDNRFSLLPGATSGTLRTAPGAVTAGKHVVGGTFDGAASALHVDKATATVTGTMVSTGSLTALSVGRAASTTTSGLFTGKAFEFLVFSRALTASEMAAVSNELGGMHLVPIAA
ncbi:hypothetical protein CH300_28065, partial [Rhodococcus sp. 15-1154-1]